METQEVIWQWKQNEAEEYLSVGDSLDQSWRIISVEFSLLSYCVRLVCCSTVDYLTNWPTIGHFVCSLKGNLYLLDKERMIIPKRGTFIVKIEGYGVDNTGEKNRLSTE